MSAASSSVSERPTSVAGASRGRNDAPFREAQASASVPLIPQTVSEPEQPEETPAVEGAAAGAGEDEEAAPKAQNAPGASTTTITFDANHEMAGKELNFTIELLEVLD